jgi:hypothetical protein
LWNGRPGFRFAHPGYKLIDDPDRHVFVGKEAHHAAAIGYTFSELTRSWA